ncbi:MAG: glycoside hydrolase family 3 C-terminal domain-containing protein [Thermofilum sp.]|jgi:beta-glucosidase|uniref:glycoside hydrolase family 3 N-terminal domain-containing protein n=1 Tax=Thermofilum sp. TaxID=1961369 RepID=UPI00258B1F60|nr:glycoside hydrolase family 3 N-terminal domain-containing protein [Thermofilum sp.]MCI4408439.1 glycoside hydrolase family 3 C-terminal domain-containing protein [Thermofilum sp.]
MSQQIIEELLSKLSIEEKVKILVGIGDTTSSQIARVPGAAGQTHPIERLNIPGFVLADGPAGVRVENPACRATAFPVEVMLASTWNPELVERVGKAMGEEARSCGVDVLLAPALNMHRHPLGGRNFEYFSEDPLLSGKIASAYVRGVQSAGIGACIKHFVGNEQETGRWGLDTYISERALREIYLKPFEIAVKEAKPWSVMSAYNKLNGVHCSENEWLLTRVLREEWGFDGFVMTDWGAGEDVVRQINAGNDVIMPGGQDKLEQVLKAVREGKIPIETIDRAVARVLSKLLGSAGYKSTPGKPDLEAHAKIAYEAAVEGMVLLKNQGALPIDRGKKIAFFGVGQILTVKGGMGSGHTHPPYVSTILDAARERSLAIDEELAKKYAEALSTYKEELEIFYKDEPDKPSISENVIGEADIYASAQRNDLAVIVITRVSGEGWDLAPEDFYLRDDEKWLIDTVSEAYRKIGKPVVAILNIGTPIDVASWREKVDAILLAWQPGQEAGRAIIDTLLGLVNPSGKLPTTFPKTLGDVPSWTFGGEPAGSPKSVTYEEDIYVGYRYYDTFGKEPAYEFGYGLSYTTFSYSDLSIDQDSEQVTVKFRVTNTGKMPGREVAQVYVKPPKGKIDKPQKELKAFKKTRLLQPGEHEDIVLNIGYKDMASFNGKEWILEKGAYKILIGSSSRRIHLEGEFKIHEEKTFRN